MKKYQNGSKPGKSRKRLLTNENKPDKFGERLLTPSALTIPNEIFVTPNENIEKDPRAVDKYVGSRVKLKRVEKGLTQSIIGDKLNLTFQQVQKYEKGVNRIGSSNLYEIAKILNVPISYFFEGYEGRVGVGRLNEGDLVDSISYCISNDSELEKEVKVLIRYFCLTKDKSMRKSIVGLVKSMSS